MAYPEFLCHYTSIDVLCKLFTNNTNGCFIFHASSVDSMNDNAEYMEARKQCRDGVEEIIMERELGIPFALCFSDKETNIPMWNMYANKGKGVCLLFNFRKIKNHIKALQKKDERLIAFYKCIYKDILSNEKLKPLDSGNQYPDTKELSKKMKDKAFIKPNCFRHEKEWRLMIWQDWVPNDNHIIHFKERKDELCPYLEIPIPVNSLERIVLRPNASEQMIDATRLLLANYGGNGISVEVAEITLKV